MKPEPSEYDCSFLAIHFFTVYSATARLALLPGPLSISANLHLPPHLCSAFIHFTNLTLLYTHFNVQCQKSKHTVKSKKGSGHMGLFERIMLHQYLLFNYANPFPITQLQHNEICAFLEHKPSISQTNFFF